MTEYHVGRDQQQLGKFTEEQIREGLFNGRFLKTDLLWSEGMDGWKPLSEVLSGSSVDTPPPAEPPPASEPEPSISTIPAAPAQVSASTFPPATPPYSPPPGAFTTPAGFGGVGSGPAAVSARPTSGTAIASLILGVVSILGSMCYVGIFTGIAGVICGHLSLGSIKRSNQTLDGKGLAIAGLVLNYLSVLITAVIIAFLVIVMAANWNEINSSSDSTPAEFPATSNPSAE